MSEERGGKLDRTLRALAHPVRRELLWLTWGEWRSAGELANYFSLRQPTVSQHLKVLRTAGLLEMRRSGTMRLFRVRARALAEVHELLAAALGAPPGSGTRRSAGRDRGPVYGPHKLRLGARLRCPPADAYALFTDEEQMRLWLGPTARAENRVGGIFAFEIDGRWRCRGRFHALEPPSRVLFSWSFREGAVPLPTGTNTVEVTLLGARTTRVTIEHHGFEEELLPVHRESWQRMLGELEKAVDARRRPRARARRRRAD